MLDTDYHGLARRSGFSFTGPSAPSTVHSQVLWKQVPKTPHTTTMDHDTVLSCALLYIKLLRQQPTLQQMRAVIIGLRNDDDPFSSFETVRQRFPYGDEGIARSVYDSIVSCLAQEDPSALIVTVSSINTDKCMDLAAPYGLSEHEKKATTT